MTASSRKAPKGETRRKLKTIIADVAPGIAHALGGPFAGAAVAQLSRAIIGDETADETVLAEALLRATPEQRIALKRAELEFQAALREADIRHLQIDADDRANARARQVQMHDRTPMALGALVICGYFIVLGVMVARKLPAGAETEFSIMLGALATMTAAVVNYFFGSSAGSREKTRLIAFPGADAINRAASKKSPDHE